jgi:hypothetical protein
LICLLFGVLTVAGGGCNVCIAVFGGGFIPFIIADTPGDDVGGCTCGGGAFIGAVFFFFSII